MTHRFLSLALAALLLSGCSGMSGRRTLIPNMGPAPDEQLVFIDRLAVAGPDEMEATGRGLRSAVRDGGGQIATLRYALWLATPGHPGHDPSAARRRLESLLVEERGLNPEARALVRIQLRTLRARVELREANARLTRENERLREQIRALTELEREMGSNGE